MKITIIIINLRYILHLHQHVQFYLLFFLRQTSFCRQHLPNLIFGSDSAVVDTLDTIILYNYRCICNIFKGSYSICLAIVFQLTIINALP
jgi:hypothetical protein